MSTEIRGIPRFLSSDEWFQKEFIKVDHKYYDQPSVYHWHDCYEFEFVKDGSVTYYCNGQEYELPAGSAYLVTPSDHHQIIGHRAELYTVLFDEVLISREFHEAILSGNGAAEVCLTGETKVIMEYLMQLLWMEWSGRSEHRKFALQRLLETVLLYYVRAVRTDKAHNQLISSAVRQAVAYVRVHFRDKITLRQVAAAIHLTPNYIGELFTQELGLTFSAYLRKTRLVYARSLLQNSGCSISEAALAAGFTSQNYFSECFKKEYGYSPAKERTNALAAMLSIEDRLV